MTRLHIHDSQAERPVDPLAPLLDGAIAGEPDQVRQLLRALAPEVTRVCRAILGVQSALLDDAVQDSLLRLTHALPSFRRDCSAKRFANRIAARTALLSRRRSQTTRSREHQAAEQLAWIAPSTPHEQQLRNRQQRLLDRLLDELPQPQADTLALRFVLGYSLEETATTLQVPLNTVRSRIRLAKQALRDRIESDRELHEMLGGAT